jgi:hypothetical protein
MCTLSIVTRFQLHIVKHCRYEVAGPHQDNPVLAIQFQRELFLCYVNACADPEEHTLKHPDYVEVFRLCPDKFNQGDNFSQHEEREQLEIIWLPPDIAPPGRLFDSLFCRHSEEILCFIEGSQHK